MKRPRVPLDVVEPGDQRLLGTAVHYLARVLRLRAGDAFVAFDPVTAKEADATVLDVDRDAMLVRVGVSRDGAVRASLSIAWVQGLAKADKCDAVVRDATELGATRVVVTATQRSVVRLNANSSPARRARWTRIAEQAARQCGRSDAPRVDAAESWDDALGSCEGAGARFCLWERATEPLAPSLFAALASGESLAFACGAEGGLEEAEVARAAQRGWTVASIGPIILRTETIAAAVLGAVRVWAGLFRYVAPVGTMVK